MPRGRALTLVTAEEGTRGGRWGGGDRREDRVYGCFVRGGGCCCCFVCCCLFLLATSDATTHGMAWTIETTHGRGEGGG